MNKHLIIFLTTIALTSAVGTYIRVSAHACQRAAEGNINLNRALNAVLRAGTAWYVRDEFRDGTRHLIYEGYYTDDNDCRTNFRMVTDSTDYLITVIALDYEPQRPVLSAEDQAKRDENNRKRLDRRKGRKECKEDFETTTRFTRFHDENRA